MEDIININEYVRTEEGYIGKLVEYIPNALNYLKIDVGREIIHCDNSRDNFIYTRYGFQLEHSPNLIDLIQCGDYVNGKLIHKVDIRKNSSYIYYGNGKTFTDYQIETVVTKEQFESISYKVTKM